MQQSLKSLIFLMLAGFLTACGGAPKPDESLSDPRGLPEMMAKRAAMLEAMADRRAATPSYVKPVQWAAMAGREDLDQLRLMTATSAPTCIPLPGDPIKTIVERARRTNIVILNEDHSAPEHRWFIGEALKALRAEGFTIYAAETFNHGEVGHAVSASTGWYSNEPIYGRTVRLAKSLGYELIAYEAQDYQNHTVPADLDPQARSAMREQAQADNLMAAIFRQRPDAKVVIHVGGGHAYKTPASGALEANGAMAARLKRASGRDPLSVSQTGCFSAADAIVIAEQRSGAEGRSDGNGAIDLFVGHPKPAFKDHRAIWRLGAGDKEVPIPAALAHRREATIIEARAPDQGDAETPIDRVLLFPGEDAPLLLPPGRYRIEAFTKDGPLSLLPILITVR